MNSKFHGMRWLAAALMVSFLAAAQGGEKKILFIDSYHEGYAWSDGITNGVKKVVGDKAELKILRMDTKRNASEDAKKKAAEEAKKVIEDWKPDVVIAADDNASKYLIVPYFKDKDLPFVFCGVNWSCDSYGFPCKNVTGMLEVSLLKPLLKAVKPFAKGDKIGHLAPDITTGHKEAENLKEAFKVDLVEGYAKDYEDWKKKFKELQGKCDILILASDGGLYKEHEADMLAFVRENTAIPTGSFYDFMAPYALMSYTKSAEEQGEWAAEAALKILGGTPASDIKVTNNKRGKLFVNLPIAKKLGVKVPLKMLKTAEVIKE